MSYKLFATVLACALALSACGDTTAEQGLYGASAGAAGSAVLNGNVVAGAAAGAAANILYCEENPGSC